MKIPFSDNPVGERPIDLGKDVAATILRIIEDGWSYAVKRVTSGCGEVVITEYLREGMRRVVEGGKLAIPLGVTVIISPGTESRSGGVVMVPDGLTDIPMLFVGLSTTGGVHDPHAIIECKRISASDGYLRTQYVVEGIDRFQTGKYARNHSIGFMVGYVLAGDTDAVVNSINAVLRRASRNEEVLLLSDILAPRRLWFSRHRRSTSLINIDIYHAFFALRGKRH